MDKTFTELENIDVLIYQEKDQYKRTTSPRPLRLFVSVPELEHPLTKKSNKILKRGFDIVFSLFVIVFLLSWIIPLLAIFVKLSSKKGPVFFKQKRTGLLGKTFLCWKIRSMEVNGDAHSKQASPGDERITLAGKFMRKLSLDELPQFYCVLIGDMSVVGPRPHMLNHTEEYSKLVDNYIIRHSIKPGVTGLSQVRGYRGEIRCPVALKNRIKLDLFYISKWNFMLDLKIVFKTFKLVLFGDENAF
ncbi:MAG: sugar transferase [Bacteroidota bacterium]|nr:sugar transferase [Bacteroidota bacterium]